VNSGEAAAADPALFEQLARARAVGLLGPAPVEDHLRHSLGFLPGLAGLSGRVGDLGSGGGVPGLPLAVARPDLGLVLIEASARRGAFLEEAIRALGLASRVTVIVGRAELVGRGPLRAGLDGVVARAFGPPAVTAECAAPLLRLGGRLVVSEPPADDPNRWPSDGPAPLGLCVGEIIAGPPRLQLLHQVAPCPLVYPRRDGVPAKRPLF
jgi:16S rRNA (guanine527-N7)-methyltransferase